MADSGKMEGMHRDMNLVERVDQLLEYIEKGWIGPVFTSKLMELRQAIAAHQHKEMFLNITTPTGAAAPALVGETRHFTVEAQTAQFTMASGALHYPIPPLPKDKN